MSAGADEVMRACALAWERFAGAVPGGWSRRERGALAVVSGAELPGFNGVWGEVADVDPAVVARLLDAVGAAGVPHCLQLRPGWSADVERVALDRGLVRVEGEPIMVLEDDRQVAAALEVEGLSLRRVAPAEGALHARVAAAGGVVRDEAPYRRIAAPEFLAMPGLRCYVGEVNGEAVATAIGLSAGDCVGVFSVATLPAHRRRGYGAAVTARAVRDGIEAGARWAWLSASPAGYPVYRRLGFVTVEQLDTWERTTGRSG